MLQNDIFLHGSVSAGVDSNDTIKIPRSGGSDPDGNQPGDLYVMIKVSWFASSLADVAISLCSIWVDPDMLITMLDYLQVKEDPVFRREGADIHVDTNLSITQVILV